jgi:hypothetical protein
MEILPPGIISKIGTYLESQDRNNCLLSDKLFRSIHYGITYHRFTITTFEKFMMLPHIIAYIRKVKPVLKSLDIILTGLWDVCTGITFSALPILLQGIDDIRVKFKHCDNIDKIQSCFSQDFLERVHVMYIPGYKFRRFDIRGKTVSLELDYNIHDVDYIVSQIKDGTRVVQVNLLNSNLDLDKFKGLDVETLNVVCSYIEGNIRCLELVHNLCVTSGSVLQLMSYIKDNEIFVKESKLTYIMFTVYSDMHMNMIISLVSLLSSDISIGLSLSMYKCANRAMAILKFCKALKSMERKTEILYTDHDSYMIACALEKRFNTVSKVNNSTNYESAIDCAALSLNEIHANINNETTRDAWMFLSLM